MSIANHYKTLIAQTIEQVKELKRQMNLKDIDKETAQQLKKRYDLTLRTLKNTLKIDFLTAGGSLSEYNDLISGLLPHGSESLDEEQKQEQEQQPQQEQQEQPKQQPQRFTNEPSGSKIEIVDVFKLNLEHIKKLSFDCIKQDTVFYNEAIDLKNQIVELVETDNLNFNVIEYYFKKIDLLNYCEQPKELKNRVSFFSQLDQLKLTLETFKNLEALRKLIKIN